MAVITVAWVGLQCVIVAFPIHTHLPFKLLKNYWCIVITGARLVIMFYMIKDFFSILY